MRRRDSLCHRGENAESDSHPAAAAAAAAAAEAAAPAPPPPPLAPPPPRRRSSRSGALMGVWSLGVSAGRAAPVAGSSSLGAPDKQKHGAGFLRARGTIDTQPRRAPLIGWPSSRARSHWANVVKVTGQTRNSQEQVLEETVALHVTRASTNQTS